MTSPRLHTTAAPPVPSARGELGVGNGRAGERPRTNTRRRPPARPGGSRGRRTAQMALAARWMLQSRHHSPLSTASPGQAAARAHSRESGQGRGSSGSAPNPGGPAPTSPSLRRLGGAPGPRGSAPVGPTKPPESPHLAAFAVSPVPPDSLSSPPGRREWRSPRPRVPAIGAGVSTSEQSPRPDVSAGTRTRTHRCAPARHLRSSCRRHPGVTPRALRVPAGQPAVPGPSSQAQMTTQGPQAGLPGKRGRGCRSWPQTRGGEGPARAGQCCRISVCPRPGAGPPPPAWRPPARPRPEGRKGVGDQVRPAAKRVARGCHPGGRPADPLTHLRVTTQQTPAPSSAPAVAPEQD